MIFKNCILNENEFCWTHAEGNRSIFYLPPSEQYCTTEAIYEGYDFITTKSGPLGGVRQQILITAIAAGFYALFPELLEDAEMQPFCMTLIGKPGTFKTTLSRKLRFPLTEDQEGELTQEVYLKERNAIIQSCTGGSILLNDLRGSSMDTPKLVRLMDAVIRPFSDRKKGPLCVIANGEPSVLESKQLANSMKERLLVIFTDELQAHKAWVSGLSNKMVSLILVSSYLGIRKNFKAIREQFKKEAEEMFCNGENAYGNIRNGNFAFQITMAHRVILENAVKQGYTEAEKAECYKKSVSDAVKIFFRQMYYQEDSFKYLLERTLENLSSRIRWVSPISFCEEAKLCQREKCSYRDIADWKTCRERQYRINKSDYVLRISKENTEESEEVGIAVNLKFIDTKFSYIQPDDNKIMIILKKGALWKEYCKQIQRVARMTNSLPRRITVKELCSYLQEKGYLLYDMLDGKANYYIEWSQGKIGKLGCSQEYLFLKEKTNVLVLYLPKALVSNLKTGYKTYFEHCINSKKETEISFENITQLYLDCVIS